MRLSFWKPRTKKMILSAVRFRLPMVLLDSSDFIHLSSKLCILHHVAQLPQDNWIRRDGFQTSERRMDKLRNIVKPSKSKLLADFARGGWIPVTHVEAESKFEQG